MLAKRAAGGRTWSGEALLFELKHENSDGKTPLEQLSAEALSQAMEKYTDGVLGKWQPKRTLVLAMVILQSVASGLNILGVRSFAAVAIWEIMLIGVMTYRRWQHQLLEEKLKKRRQA